MNGLHAVCVDFSVGKMPGKPEISEKAELPKSGAFGPEIVRPASGLDKGIGFAIGQMVQLLNRLVDVLVSGIVV